MSRGFLYIALPYTHTCIQHALASCLSCLSSLTGDKQDSNYESCYFYSSLLLQLNNTVKKKQEGQSYEQNASWLLHYIILEFHLFICRMIKKINTCIHPRKLELRFLNCTTNMGYVKTDS